MCGIATIAIGKGSRNRIPYPLLRNLTSELLVQLGARGQDASGIAVINEDECAVFKKPLRPNRLVVRPKFEETLNKIGPTTNFILLHSRLASVGNNQDNYNNHPIIAEPIIGVHNGTLTNDEQLFEDYEDRFTQEGSVDSEVIFRLLNMYLREGLEPEQSMRRVSQQLIGAFTGAAVDMHHPNRMILFRVGRPLSLVTIPHYDVLITVSEPRFYDKAKSAVGIKAKDKFTYPREETGIIIDVNEGRISKDLVDFNLPLREESRRATWRYNNWINFVD